MSAKLLKSDPRIVLRLSGWCGNRVFLQLRLAATTNIGSPRNECNTAL